jgi:hypothetical protein
MTTLRLSRIRWISGERCPPTRGAAAAHALPFPRICNRRSPNLSVCQRRLGSCIPCARCLEIAAFFVKGLGFNPCLRRDIVSVGGCVPRQDNQDEARKRPDHQSRDVQGGHVANIPECDEVGSHSRSSPQIPRCIALDVQGQEMVNSLTTGRGAQPLCLWSRI